MGLIYESEIIEQKEISVKRPPHKHGNYLAFLGLFLPASLVIIFYMYIGLFNRLLADDYCSIYYGRRLGLFRSVWYWYITWHGGFSASAADWFLSFTGPGLLPVMAVITLVVWISFAVFAWRKVFYSGGFQKGSFVNSLILGVILIYATLAISPDISQSFFWWGGARGYFLPLIFATLYWCLYLIFVDRNWFSWQSAIWYLVSFGLVFFIGGFAEVYTPVQLVIFAGLILWDWLVRKSTTKDAHFRFLLAGLVGAFLSLVVMVAAPGNYLRQEYFPDPPNLFTVLSISINGYVAFLQSIFGSVVAAFCVIGSMLAAGWAGVTALGDSGQASPGPWQGVMVLAIGFVLAFGCFPAAAYGVSEPPPLRTQIIPSFLLMVGMMAGGFMLGQWLGARYNINAIRVYLLILAGLFVVTSAWGEYQFLVSIQQDHILFARKWDQVDAMILRAVQNGAEEVLIPSMKNWAGLEYPSHRLKYWPNVCFRQYYGIKVLAPPPAD